MHVLNQAFKSMHVRGDLIECGVGAGHTTFPLANLALEMAPEKNVFACDTFSGLPYDDVLPGPNPCKKGELDGGAQFRGVLRAMGPDYTRNIVPIEGLVEETLPAQLSNRAFCFAWLDLDLYLPTRFALSFIVPRVPVGGIIGLHDYGFSRCPGIEKAVNEITWRAWRGEELAGNCLFLQRLEVDRSAA
jgi:hypothetical protein